MIRSVSTHEHTSSKSKSDYHPWLSEQFDPETFEFYYLTHLWYFPQGHETSALLILEKITDRNLINATNAALQTYVLLLLLSVILLC